MAPVISKEKIFLQRLWRSKLEWNDLLPAEEYQEWQQSLVSLENINNIEIPRRILVAFPEVIEIHGFADVSERCYGAAVYCKSKNLKSETLVRLITSKSRVAPIKSLTIPRLELCAAVLLAKLVKRVVAALQLESAEVYLWSDSMIVLAWLRKEPMDLNIFVQNIVAKIQELYPNQFVENLKDINRVAGPLTTKEFEKAETFLVKKVQEQEFSSDINHLKTVHIELVSDLTSQAFIAALKRFMARRGKCAKLFSDNGKNFVGASNEIKKLLEIVRNPDEKLANYLAAEGIEWKFIPARSPNLGGLWEAAIKSFNGDRYRAMITNFFIPELNNHDVQELWFQQDGETCHTARATIDLLKDTFGGSLISRFGPVNWPPRSCDLTPLDYFLWGYVVIGLCG
ncbi:integrase catalytic domain-containing protein [Trichonephila clavipes]|nr:integrase catalytic domain-containing protein [Trichonephila clavipes]